MNRTARLVAILGVLVSGVFASLGMSQTSASNSWSPAGQMTQARTGAAAVLLTDGRVLITGGSDAKGIPQATTEVYDPTTGAFTAAPAMNVARANHAAIVLKTGDVLVTGGLTTGKGYSDSAEIYSVNSKHWTLLQSSIGTGIAYHAMAQLSDGNVLIAGGTSTTKVVGSIVLFSLTDRAFMPVGMLQTPRTNAVAAGTPDGRVLIAGGTDVNGAVLTSTEIFTYDRDTMTGSIAPGPSMVSPRVGATATGTYDGVAVIGGNNGEIDLGTAEIFSQWTNTFKTVSGGTPRSNHFAALLPKNGGILSMGGTGGTKVDLLLPWANDKAGAFFAGADSLVNQDGGFASPLTLGSLLTGGGKGNSASAASLYWFPTISTDKPDYAPGKPVHMTGTGFQPLESVTLHIHEWVKQSTDDDPDVTVTADLLGNFTYSGYAPDIDDLGARYHLTAVGMTSGYQAQVIFTDSITFINFQNQPLDQPAAPASGTATAGECGNLIVHVGGATPYGTINLTDSTNGTFYTSVANCTNGTTPITSLTPTSSTTNLYYRNSATGSPTVTACTGFSIFGICLGTGTTQTESIYGAPTQLVFVTQPGGGGPGAVWQQQPDVQVQDASYNRVGSNSDVITLTISTNPAGGTLTCAQNPLNASSGDAAFSNCSINNVSTSCYVLKATDATLGFTATSDCFYISNPGNAGKSTVSANPTSVVDNGNTTSTITVTIKDLNGSPVVGKTVTLAANLGSSTVSGNGIGVTNSSGVVTFAVSDTVPEAVTYTATDATDGVTVTQTATVTFTPGQVNAGNSTVTRTPTTVNANGVSFSTITVTLNDSDGNPVPSETVTLSQGSGHSVITTVSGTTNSSGVATFTVTDTTVESVTYTASYAGTYGSGTLSTHTVSVSFTGTATTLTLTVNPNNTTFGTSPIILTSGLSVTTGGAPVGGVAVSFYEATGTCSAGSTFVGSANTDSGGTATFSWTTTALAAGTYHICAFSAATTISNVAYNAASSPSQTLTVAGAATTLTWTTAPPGTPQQYNPNNTASFTVTATTNSCATVTYAVTGGCSLIGTNGIRMTSGTTACQVSANVAARLCGTTQFGAATLGPVTVTASLATQAALSVRPVSGSVGDGASFTVSTQGGSGSGAVTFNATGACTISGTTVTMNATGTNQTCTVTASKASDGNYAATATPLPSATYTSNGIVIVTISNTSQTFTGLPLPVTVTTAPPGPTVAVDYSAPGFCTYTVPGSCPTAPTNVGSYTVTATVISGGTGSATATETVSQQSAGLNLALQSGTTNPSPYGTMDYFVLTFGSCTPGTGPTGNVQLVVDGTPVVGAAATLNGSCTAVVLSTATIDASPVAHQVSVQYGGDSNHPQGFSNTVFFTVSADTTQVTLSATGTSILVGQPDTFTATVTPNSLAAGTNGPTGTVQFLDGATVIDTETLPATGPYTVTFTDSSLAAGLHNISAVYVPGGGEFSGSSSAIAVNVGLNAPTINWTAPQSIVYGTPLSAVQLNATATDSTTNATVPGTFVYTPAANFVVGVGTTTLSVTFTPDSSVSSTYSTNSATVQITVTPVTLTVTADNQTMVYGATVPTLTATITGFVAGDVPSQVTGAASCTITGTTPYTVLGSPYTISCTQGTLAEPNYTFTTFVNGQLTVTATTPTLSLLCPEVTYDGNPHPCVGSAVGADGSTQVAGNWTYSPQQSYTAAGSYPETGTFTSSDPNNDYQSGGQASGTLIIDQATSSVTLTCPPSVAYTGSAQTPCTATYSGAGGLSGSLTVTYSNNTNPGTATASASYAGDANHTASNNSVNFAISGAPVSATAGTGTWTYNGNTETIPACVVSGGYIGNLSCTDNPVSVGPGVGAGTVTPVVSGDTSSFTIISNNGAWSITQATSTVTVTCPASVGYNGAAQQPCTATVKGVGGADPLNSTLTITYTNNTDVGTATASASFPGDANHSPSSMSVNFAITTAAVTVTAGSYTGVYDGSTHAPTPCTIAGTYKGSLSCSNTPSTVGPDVSSGPVTASASGDTLTDFAITYVPGTYSITKATATVTVTCPSSVVYNGAAQTPCSAVVTGPNNLNQTLTVTYSNNTAAGTATANASYATTTDYLADTGSANFTILPAAVTATAGSLTGTYNGSTQTPSACVITGAAIGVSTLTCTNSPTPDGPGVGSGTETPVVNGSGQSNFTITLVNGTWSIAPLPVQITLGNLAQFFTGSPVAPVTVTTVPTPVAISVLYGTNANPTNPTSATPPSAVGSYTVTATTTNPNYAGFVSNTLVISSASSSLNLTLRSGDSEPSLYGQFVHFDLPLSGAPCPTGSVQWFLNGVASGSPVTLPATCSTPLTYQTDTLVPGTYTLYAVFTSGDTNYTSGTSNTVTHVVSADTTSVNLTASGTSLNVGQSVTFTAYVIPTATPGSGALVPTGTVNFFDGATLIGSGTLTQPIPGLFLATFTTTSLAAGSHTISATYVPTDGTEYPGSSSGVDVTVTITKIAPSIAWATPGSIVYGTPLTATQLNATATDPNTDATVPGSFSYNPPAGTLVHAGATNTLTATFTPTNTNVYSTSTATVNLVVTPATPTLSLTCPAATYNGNPQQTCVGSAATTITGGTTPTGTWVYNPATETAAGTYSVTGTFTSTNGDFQGGGTATGTLVINKAPVTATAGSYTGVYDGLAHAPSACVVTGSYKGTLTCTDNPASVGPGVGSGTVAPLESGDTLADFAITETNGTYSITKATSTVTVTCTGTFTYNGAAQTPCTATVTGAGGLSQPVTPVTYTNNTNAGTATASATYAGDANHSASTGTANFTISPAPVTVTAGSYNAVYDGAAHATAPACAVTGTFKGTLTCVNNPATVGPAVGSGTVTSTVSGGTLTNFAITAINGTWSITKASSTVTVSCPATVTYNGAAQTPCTANVTGAGGLSQTLTVTYTSDTNVGTATASASFAGDASHAASSNSATFTINPAAVTATAGNFSGVYNGATRTPSACAVTGAFKGSLTCTNNPTPVGPAVGSGAIQPVVAGGSANFTITLVNGAWSITQATSTVTITCPASVTYNGAAQTPCTATVTGAGGLNQALTPVTYTNNTNAGTATASASYAGDANHAASSNTANFTINRAPVTATAGSYNAAYDGSAHAPAPACAVTGAYKGALICTNNPASVGPGVGSGSVTPTVSGDTLTNFTITAVNGAWSITKATSTVTLTCPASVVYNGAAQTPCTASVTGPGLSQSITPTYANNTNAGTATATATYAGDANHAAATRTANFTINPAPVTATAGGYTGTYDGTAHATAPACAVTGTFKGTLTCTNNPASVGPAVGSGTVTPTVTGGTLTNFAITSVNGAWSITKATSTVTVTCPASVVYNSAAQTPCTATATGAGGLSQSLTVTYSNNTNVGTATASASFAGDANYAAGSNTASFTISPATATATAGSFSGVYNGATRTPSACTVTGAFTGGLSCTNNPASVGPGVGSGTVTPTVSGGSSNFTITAVDGAWSITQATSLVTVTCPASVLYNGAAQTPCTATATGVGGLNQTLVVSYTSNTNVGTATASASFAGDANHAASTNTATFAINPALVTATAGGYSGVYDGSAHATAPTCAVTGAFTGGLSCANTPASVGPAVGSGTVTPTVSGGSSNFTITAVNGAWSITQATSLVAVTCPASVVYNGAAQTPCTATVTGAGGLSQSLTVTYTNNINAGTATASASFAGDANHAAGSNTANFTISPAAATATAGSFSGVYNGATHAPSACSVTGTFTGGLSCTDNPASVGPAVGSGTVTPTVSGGSSNFAITAVNGAWSITQATSLVTVTCPASVTYNGAAQTPCTATVTGAGGLSQSLTVNYTNNTSVGTATASASFAGDANHAAGSNSANFAIDQAVVTATAGSYTGVYDGSSHAPSACSVTGAFTGGLTCTNNPVSVGPGVGSGTVTPTVSGTLANFAITPVNGAWSITNASSLVTVSCPASVIYNGAAQTPCTATVTGAGGLNQSLTVNYTNNTNVGTATASASFAGDANHAAGSGTANFTISKAAVTATAGSYTGVYDGAAHATLPLCAITGAFTDGLSCANNPASVGPAIGSGTVTTTVSGGTLTNFTITTVNGAWSITKASSSVTVNCPASVAYSGAAQTPCTATVTGAGGLSQSLTVTYSNNTNVGTATASASFAGDASHAASSNTANFTITQAVATVTLSNLAQFYTGSPLPVTVTTVPSGLGVTVLYSSASYPSSITAPTNPGSYTVTATVTNANYVGQATQTLVIYPATSGLTLQLRIGMPEPSPYGTMVYFDLGLGGTPCPTGTVQFFVDGTATGSAVTLNGSSCTNPVTFGTATLALGSHSVYAAYSGDTLHSSGNSNTVTHAVTADTTAVTLAASATTVNVGQQETLTATVTPSSLDPSAQGPAGTVEFFDGSTSLGVITLSSTSPYTAVLNTSSLTVGSHSISATYTSSNLEFTGSSSAIAVTVTVDKIAPTITWSNPANIVFGTALSGTQLNATATDATKGNSTVAGTFTYNPLAGTVLPVGTVNLEVSFTPTDTATYLTQTATVTLTVTSTTPTLSLTCTEVTYDGNTHACVGNAKAVDGVTTVGGSWSYAPASETAAGSYPVTGTFTSTDGNYQSGTATGTLKIDPAPVTATAGSYNGIDDGSSHAPSACVVTGAYTVGLSCTNNPASVGPGVGSGTVIPVVSGGSSNFAITPVNGTWAIGQPSSTLTTVICPASVVFNGAAQTPCTATVTGSGGFNQALTVSYINNTNAGTATASASFAGDASHPASSNSATFAINPVAVTATAGGYSAVYDGSSHATSACALTGAYTLGLSCANNPALVGPAIGSGTVTPTVSGGTLTNFAITPVNGAWSITQASSTVSVTCPVGVVYNGTAQTPCTATVIGAGSLNQSVTVTYINNTNAGTATANASFAGDASHAAGSNSATFAINPAPVTATAGSYTGVVDASTHAPSACAVTGTYTGTLTCTNNPASVGPAVGSGAVLPVVSGGTLTNFAITAVNGAWSITQASSTVTVSCPAGVLYNGAAQTPCTATVTGAGGLNQSVNVTYTNNINAGTATANASFAGDASHTASSNSGSFAINPAPVTATAGSYSGVVDASTHAPTACAVTGTYTGTLICTDNPASVGPGVGSGSVLPVVSGGTLSNFAITAVNGAWSITPASSTATTVSCPASVLYNGAAQTPCTATVTGSGGFSQALTVTYTNNTNAGTATANASFAGDATHPASSNSATFAINPAPVTATAGSYSGVVDASTHAPSACAVTGAYTGTLICTDNPASVGPAVGSGAVLPVVSGGTLSNFAITAVNGAWSITQASSTTTVTCPAGVLYNGVAQTPCTATVTGSGGLNQSVTVTYTNNINAGTATANASFAGDASHAASSNSGSFAINPAPVTATAGSYSGVVDASTHAPSACAVTGTYTGTLTCTDNPASVGPAVGSGTVLPVVSGGTLSNFAITAINGAWSITPASSTATTVSCPASVLYNGAAQTPCTATVTGSGGFSQALTVTYTNNTNAGTATANASFAGDATHPASSNSGSFAINPAPVTATAGSYSGVVDASTHAPSACAVTGAYTGTLICTDNPASVGPAVGSGTVLPVVSGGTLSNFAITAINGAWSITPASSTATTVSCPASVLYNGAAQTPCTATVTGSGGFSQSLTVTYTNNTNAGTATANASFAGDATHPASSNSATFAINPAPVTATAGSYSGVVDASTHAPSACAVTGTFTGTLTCTNNPASVGPAVGSGAVLPVVSGGTLSNFAITAINGAWSITQASSTATTVSCPASVLYNGAAQTPCTATVTGSGGFSQALTVTYTNNTNAGTATANASFAGDATHPASSNSATFAINPAPVTATAGSYSGVVDASTHAPSACAVTGTFTGTLTCTNNPASVGPAVGSGAVLPVVSGGTLSNFAITAINGAWSITQASSTATTVSCPASVLYNGAAQTPCTATVTGSGGFSQSLTVTYTNNTNAGTATANASFAGDATHPASSNSATFAINPAPVTATAGSYSGVDDGSAHATAPACAVTGAYTGGLGCTNNPASVGPGVGSGTVTPVVSGGTLSNFAITPVNGTWNITQLLSTVAKVTCPASVVYSGAAQTPCTATVTGSGGFSQSLTVTYTNNINAGTATSSASFAGDATHAASSNTASFTINQASQIITFTQPTSPVLYGVPPIVLSATGGASGKPVVFNIDASSTGVGSIGGNSLTVGGIGTLIINANQAGDSNYLAAAQVTRAIVVNLATLTVAANNAGRVYGTNNPAFTGTVTGAVRGDTYTESFSTIATISSNAGTYPIVPSVAGANLSDYTVTLQNGTLTITQAGTATTMNTSSSSVTPGQNVTLTAQVAPATTGTPTGSVAFYDGSTLLGTVPLTAGTATISTSSLTPGSSNVLQAVYSGDNNFTTSSSSTSSVSVAQLDFTMAVSGANSFSVSPGGKVTFQVDVTPLYGTYPGQVNFAGSGLPFGGSIAFSPSTIAAGSGKQTIAVTIQTSTLVKQASPQIGRKLAPFTLAFLLIPLLGVRRLRRQGRRLTRLASLMLLLACTLAGVMMTGCGGNASLKQIEQDYSILVTATSGNMQHTAPVVLKVK